MNIPYYIVEVLILIAWCVLFARTFRTAPGTPYRMQRTILLLGPVVTLLLDLGNNRLLGEDRSVYFPDSLLWTPGYRFPVAVMLLGGVFVWLAFTLARRTKKVGGIPAAAAAFLISVALCLPLNLLMTAHNYWQMPFRELPNQALLMPLLYASYLANSLLVLGLSASVLFFLPAKNNPATKPQKPEAVGS